MSSTVASAPLAAVGADAEDVGAVPGDGEAVAPCGLVHPVLHLVGRKLLDLVAGLADQVVVMGDTTAPKGLFSVTGEHVEQTRVGQRCQGPVDRGQTDRLARAPQLG